MVNALEAKTFYAYLTSATLNLPRKLWIIPCACTLYSFSNYAVIPCHNNSNCTELPLLPPAPPLSITIWIGIASGLGIILCVLTIVCVVMLVVCLKRKQGRRKRVIIGNSLHIMNTLWNILMHSKNVASALEVGFIILVATSVVLYKLENEEKT